MIAASNFPVHRCADAPYENYGDAPEGADTPTPYVNKSPNTVAPLPDIVYLLSHGE